MVEVIWTTRANRERIATLTFVYYIKGKNLYVVDLWDTRREPAKFARRIRSK